MGLRTILEKDNKSKGFDCVLDDLDITKGTSQSNQSKKHKTSFERQFCPKD